MELALKSTESGHDFQSCRTALSMMCHPEADVSPPKDLQFAGTAKVHGAAHKLQVPRLRLGMTPKKRVVSSG